MSLSVPNLAQAEVSAPALAKAAPARGVRTLVAITLVGFAACCAAIALLPGRTASHARISLAEASAPPTADGFRLDGMTWSLAELRSDPSLASFRTLFEENCKGLLGLDAAVCVSKVFAAHFPHGSPKQEFLGAVYDPKTDLQSHLDGEPGHCVTRSGLAPTVLLSVGIPARQVQIDWGEGHNVFEVYDAKLGWVAFDPTFGLLWGSKEHPLSIADAVGRGTLTSVQVAEPRSIPPDAPLAINEAWYPDPWLYTRVGKSAAPYPFRGRFAHVGAWSIKYGFGQQLARGGALFFAFALLALFVRSRRLQRPIAERAAR